MEQALDGCSNVRLTTFTGNDRDSGRGSRRKGEAVVTDGVPAVSLRYEDLNGRDEAVYIALVDVSEVVAYVREETAEERVLSSVAVQSVSSGFTRTCPVCGKNASTDSCLMLRQWLLPSPSLSVDNTALVHHECLEQFADALSSVWQHTGAGIAASL